MTMCNSEDRSMKRAGEPDNTQGRDTQLYQMTSALELIDPWRQSHPTDREYTFYSHAHNSFARLDYLFYTASLLPRIRESTIHKLVISDHSPISLVLENFLPHDNTRQGRFPSYLKHNEPFKRMLEDAWSE